MAYGKKSRPVPRRYAKARGLGDTQSQVSRPSAIVLGDELEYRIARLHIYMGYFVRRGCPIYTIAALDRATDLDVLAIRYAEPFHHEFLVIECKSGDAGPLDRIFWLSGVRTFLGAEEALLIRKGTKWNIKEFAKQCGVQILDLFRVTELESAYGIGEADWPGISDRNFYAQELTLWNETLAADPKLWELYLTLSSEIRYDEPFVGTNYILSQLRLLTRGWSTVPGNSFHRFLLAECLTQLAVYLMHIAEQSFDLNSKDREGFIRKGLTYGSLEPRYAERILKSAYNLTRQAVLHYTNKEVDIEKSLFQMPVPPGADQILAIVEDLLKSYPISLNFPQVCDLLLTEIFTKAGKPTGWFKRIFPQGNHGPRVDLIRRFLKSLVTAEACPSYVLESLTIPVSEPVVPMVSEKLKVDDLRK